MLRGLLRKHYHKVNAFGSFCEELRLFEIFQVINDGLGTLMFHLLMLFGQSLDLGYILKV